MIKKLKLWFGMASFVATLPVVAQAISYSKDVAPLLKNQCLECHGADSPTLKEFRLNKEAQAKFVKEKTGPRLDSLEFLLQNIATGMLARRLDDGKHAALDGKVGSMYKYLGESDDERAKNFVMMKAWFADAGWNPNPTEMKGELPMASQEELEKLRLKFKP